MAYDPAIADRIRRLLDGTTGLEERKMFGGLSFLVHGNMSVGVSGDELMVRVGQNRDEEALARPGSRPMDFTGRRMRGWITVAPEGFARDPDLGWWVDAGVAHARSLPPK